MTQSYVKVSAFVRPRLQDFASPVISDATFVAHGILFGQMGFSPFHIRILVFIGPLADEDSHLPTLDKACSSASCKRSHRS